MLQWLFGKKKQENKEEPPKKSKSQEQKEAQDKWKYDFLLQFLSGPVWKTSLLDFIDFHCVVFDNEQQNKFQYTKIHNNFKQLVANLFDGMMQQVGLDEEQLAQLLQKGFQSKQQKIFNQLLLVDDFLKFKKLMINRNKTLEQQAIKALQQHKNLGSSAVQKVQKKNNLQLQAIRQSQRLEAQRKRLELQQEQQLRKIIQLSKRQAQQQTAIKQLQKKASLKQQKQIKKAPQEKPISSPIKQIGNKLLEILNIFRDLHYEFWYIRIYFIIHCRILHNENQQSLIDWSSIQVHLKIEVKNRISISNLQNQYILGFFLFL